jgi:membrane associated rhomboid family serine protease
MFFPYRDDNPRILVPYVNYSLIALNVLVFLYQMGLGLTDPRLTMQFVYDYGLIPADFALVNIFTSMFIHGGLFHLVGNMWFLWIFGDNVESAFGHWKYFVFYLLCGIGAALTQVVINTSSLIPMVGASGAIAGVLGTYMVRYPHARVHVLIFIFIFITTIQVPAFYVLGFWFLVQLTNGLGTLGIDTTGGVAWFAHVGGFTVGVILDQLYQKVRFERY